jgi:hypothetical protein
MCTGLVARRSVNRRGSVSNRVETTSGTRTAFISLYICTRHSHSGATALRNLRSVTHIHGVRGAPWRGIDHHGPVSTRVGVITSTTIVFTNDEIRPQKGETEQRGTRPWPSSRRTAAGAPQMSDACSSAHDVSVVFSSHYSDCSCYSYIALTFISLQEVDSE